jgi:hypothetical protein
MSDKATTIRIPKAEKFEAVAAHIRDDEFVFPIIKSERDNARFKLPAPLKDDEDNYELAKTFQAVVCYARKNNYQSDEDKAEGKPVPDRRELYLLRTGKLYPERVFLSPSSVRNWKNWLVPIIKGGGNYHQVLVEFSLEKAENKKGQKWYVWVIKTVRTLTAQEMEHIANLQEVINSVVKTYEDEAELDKWENKALGITSDDDDEVDRAVKNTKQTRAQLESEEEEKPRRKQAAKKSKPAEDDEDEDEEEEKPKPKAKAKAKPVDDEDEDEDEKPKGKPKAKSLEDEDDDEDEEEVKPTKAKKSKPVDEDDEDEDELDDLVTKGKSTKKKAAKSLEDDDEDED